MYPRAELQGISGGTADVTVVGSGATGLAVAALVSEKGHIVQVTNRSARGLDEIRRRKGIFASWDWLSMEQTIARVDRVELLSDVSELGSVLVLAVGGGAESKILRGLGAALEAVDLLVVLSGQVGAGIACELALGKLRGELPVLEMGFPFVARECSPGAVDVYGKKEWMPFACAPPNACSMAQERWLNLFDLDYQPVTPQWACLHAIPRLVSPLLTLFSAARIGRGERFQFYSEGSFCQLDCLVDALDRERQALGEAREVSTMSTLAWLNQTYGMQCVSFAAALAETPAYSRATAPASLEHRHLLDNVLLGVVPLTEMGARLGVPTPILDSIIELASALLARDLRSEGRSRAGWLDELLGAKQGPLPVEAPVV